MTDAPAPTEGSLADHALSDLLAGYARERRSGRLHITTSAGEAELRLTDGSMSEVRFGPVQGETALLRLLAFREGTFRLEAQPLSAGGMTSTEVAGVMARAQEHQAEVERHAAHLGGLSERLHLDLMVLARRSQEVPPEIGPVLRGVDGKRRVMDILAASELPDVTTLRVLRKLKSMGVLRTQTELDREAEERAREAERLSQPPPNPQDSVAPMSFDEILLAQMDQNAKEREQLLALAVPEAMRTPAEAQRQAVAAAEAFAGPDATPGPQVVPAAAAAAPAVVSAPVEQSAPVVSAPVEQSAPVVVSAPVEQSAPALPVTPPPVVSTPPPAGLPPPMARAPSFASILARNSSTPSLEPPPATPPPVAASTPPPTSAPAAPAPTTTAPAATPAMSAPTPAAPTTATTVAPTTAAPASTLAPAPTAFVAPPPAAPTTPAAPAATSAPVTTPPAPAAPATNAPAAPTGTPAAPTTSAAATPATSAPAATPGTPASTTSAPAPAVPTTLEAIRKLPKDEKRLARPTAQPSAPSVVRWTDRPPPRRTAVDDTFGREEDAPEQNQAGWEGSNVVTPVTTPMLKEPERMAAMPGNDKPPPLQRPSSPSIPTPAATPAAKAAASLDHPDDDAFFSKRVSTAEMEAMAEKYEEEAIRRSDGGGRLILGVAGGLIAAVAVVFVLMPATPAEEPKEVPAEPAPAPTLNVVVSDFGAKVQTPEEAVREISRAEAAKGAPTTPDPTAKALAEQLAANPPPPEPAASPAPAAAPTPAPAEPPAAAPVVEVKKD
ncbi:MAG: DUF4388 domain-containing protein, partial [Myxococcota bacterium]